MQKHGYGPVWSLTSGIIIAAGILGVTCKRFIKESYQDTMIKAAQPEWRGYRHHTFVCLSVHDYCRSNVGK